jgi:hypothetical protein
MNRIRNQRPSPATAIALTALIVAIGGAAFAAIPDSNDVIHGCYDRGSGALRVIDTGGKPPRTCVGREAPISWNQQGPTGDAGATGPTGPAGQVGPDTVGTTDVIDGSLRSIDIAGDQGTRALDLNPQPAQSCSEFYWGIGPREGGGVLVLNPPQNLPDGLFAIATVGQTGDNNPGYWFRICNLKTTTIDAPTGTWTYKFFEP